MTKKQPLGWILDEFQSPIDGRFCVAILTPETTNRKTGNMMQVWILRQDISPVHAVNIGEDLSICGNCPHRKDPETGNRTCYVNVGQAPNSVWKAYHRGRYKDGMDWNERHHLEGRFIRWGAYGDPSVINVQIFNAINSLAKGHTGYTHQWQEPWAQVYKKNFMASVDNYTEQKLAAAHGWKTFQVVPENVAGAGMRCPATVNDKSKCLTCHLCDGDRADIWVPVHGSGKKHFKPTVSSPKVPANV